MEKLINSQNYQVSRIHKFPTLLNFQNGPIWKIKKKMKLKFGNLKNFWNCQICKIYKFQKSSDLENYDISKII